MLSPAWAVGPGLGPAFLGLPGPRLRVLSDDSAPSVAGPGEREVCEVKGSFREVCDRSLSGEVGWVVVVVCKLIFVSNPTQLS